MKLVFGKDAGKNGAIQASGVLALPQAIGQAGVALDADLGGDGLGRGGTIPCDHHHPDAEIAQAPNHGLGIFPWRVLQGHQARQTQTALRPRCDSQDSITLACQSVHVGVGKADRHRSDRPPRRERL